MSRAALVSLKGNKEVGGWGISGVREGVSIQSWGGGDKLGKERKMLFFWWIGEKSLKVRASKGMQCSEEHLRDTIK